MYISIYVYAESAILNNYYYDYIAYITISITIFIFNLYNGTKLIVIRNSLINSCRYNIDII